MNQYSLIPEHVMTSMQRYVESGCQLGGFLTAVFSNNLFGAIARADEDDLVLIPTYVKYIQNKLPASCHGDDAKVKDWIKRKYSERRIKDNERRIKETEESEDE
jgi:hypothetical protein